MAAISITRARTADIAAWPQICVYCGQPAAQRIELPRRHRGKLDRLQVPACDRHAMRPSRLGLVERVAVVLLTMWIVGCIAGIALTVSPRQNDPRNAIWQGFLGLLVLAIPAGIALGWWCMPVHVTDESKHWFTLAGVNRRFAQAWLVQVRRDADSAPIGTRFEVRLYRADQEASFHGAIPFLAVVLAAAGVGGMVLAGASLAVAELTQGWTPNDLRYLALIGGWTFLYAVAGLSIVGWRVWNWGLRPLVVTVALLSAAALLVAASALLLRWGARESLPLSASSHFVRDVPASLLAGLFVLVHVRTTRMRHGIVAGLAGLLAPMTLLAIDLALTWDTPAFSKPSASVAAVLALGSCVACYYQAQSPFCTRCNQWMLREVLGGVSQPPTNAVELLQSGQVTRLLDQAAPDAPGPGDVELAIHYCPACRQRGELVLEATALNARKPARTTLGRWVYPGAAWEQARMLFPKWQPSQFEAEDQAVSDR
jgi:hypothetical protein